MTIRTQTLTDKNTVYCYRYLCTKDRDTGRNVKLRISNQCVIEKSIAYYDHSNRYFDEEAEDWTTPFHFISYDWYLYLYNHMPVFRVEDIPRTKKSSWFMDMWIEEEPIGIDIQTNQKIFEGYGSRVSCDVNACDLALDLPYENTPEYKKFRKDTEDIPF